MHIQCMHINGSEDFMGFEKIHKTIIGLAVIPVIILRRRLAL